MAQTSVTQPVYMAIVAEREPDTASQLLNVGEGGSSPSSQHVRHGHVITDAVSRVDGIRNFLRE